MNEDVPVDEVDAWYSKSDDGIRVNARDEHGRATAVVIDIRDAVYFRYRLDGAINDYEKAASR